MVATRLKHVALVVFVGAVVMLTNLGGPRLWDRDEPRNAGCAREMLLRGDWVVPTFNGELRTHKPVLLYWCMLVSYNVLGVSEFAARLPSALAAMGTVVCTYLIGRRLFSPQAGIWAAIALASSVMFAIAGRAATPDSVLIFSTTLALTIYVFGTFRPRFETTPLDTPPQLQMPGHYFPQHWPMVFAFYAAMGLAMLAKGPVGLVLPTAVIGMFLLIVRLPRRAPQPLTIASTFRATVGPFEPLHFLATCWYMRPITALLAATAIALPWYWAVGAATEGEFLRSFFLEHNLGRATGAMEGHRGNVLFYPLAILVGFLPWSAFALPLLIDLVLQLRRREGFNPGYVLAACWIGVFVGLFSLAKTKLPSYVTPCYPALALLMGSYLDRWSRETSVVAGRWPQVAFGMLVAIGGAITVGVPLAAQKFLPGEEWLGVLGLVPLVGGVVCWGLAAVRNHRAATASFAATAVAFVTLAFAVGAQQVDRHQTNQVILDAVNARAGSPPVASYKILEPSWVFYGNRIIQELPKAGPISGPAVEPPIQVVQFFQTQPEGCLITTRKRLEQELRDVLPEDVTLLAETRLLFKNDSLVLIGRPAIKDGLYTTSEGLGNRGELR